jgi:hypothetical protein
VKHCCSKECFLKFYLCCCVIHIMNPTSTNRPNSCSHWYYIIKKSCFHSGTLGKHWRRSGLHVGTSAAETDLQTGWSLLHQTWGLHCWVQFKLQVHEIKILDRLLLFVNYIYTYVCRYVCIVVVTCNDVLEMLAWLSYY